MQRVKSKPKFSDFKNVELIGQGAFGTVYKGMYEKNNKYFAIKKLPKKKIINQNMSSQVRKEIQIMGDLNHPNIVKLYDVLEDQEHIYLVLELADNGQLYSKLIKKGRFDEAFTKSVVQDLMSALEYLHSRDPPIIHRDIKPENILLDKDDRVKLADFGWSNFSNKQRTTYCGTYDYLAPEMIDKSGHDEKLDIWCLGVLVYEMLTGKPPFAPTAGEDETRRLQENILGVKISFPEDFPVLAKDFVMGMLRRNPKQRSTLKELRNHQWLMMKPVSKFESIPNPALTQQSSQEDPSSDGQNYKRIIADLNRKNQQLQKQVNSLKISQQVLQQQQKELPKQPDDRRNKLVEEQNDRYKKEVARLQADLQQRSKEITKLKGETRQMEDLRKNAQRYKNERNKLQESYNQQQRLFEELEKKFLAATERHENQKLDYELKLKQAKYRSANDQVQLDSPEFVGELNSSIQDLVKKFNESKKLLGELAKRQNAQTEAEKQLQQLRFQQNNLREELRMELKDQYQQQMDEVISKARDELFAERDKWFSERQQLSSLDRESTMDTDSSSVAGIRDHQLQAQLKLTRELNSFLQRRVKQQQYKIKDFEDMLKKKK